MLIVPIAVLAAAAYSAASIQFSRKIYKQTKVKLYETHRGRVQWDNNHKSIVGWTLVMGCLWLPLFAISLPVWGVTKAFKGIGWLITHDQEIADPDKIAELEKEIFGIEPEDAKPKVEAKSETPMKVEDMVRRNGHWHSSPQLDHHCHICNSVSVVSGNVNVRATGNAIAIGQGAHANTGITIRQKAKAGNGSTVIQVASGNGVNISSGWDWED